MVDRPLGAFLEPTERCNPVWHLGSLLSRTEASAPGGQDYLNAVWEGSAPQCVLKSCLPMVGGMAQASRSRHVPGTQFDDNSPVRESLMPLSEARFPSWFRARGR